MPDVGATNSWWMEGMAASAMEPRVPSWMGTSRQPMTRSPSSPASLSMESRAAEASSSSRERKTSPVA